MTIISFCIKIIIVLCKLFKFKKGEKKMKKRLLWTLMLLSSTTLLACPACGGFDGADIDSNHEDNHSAMTSFTNKDGSINLNNFKDLSLN